MKIYLIQILIVSVFSSCVVTQEQCISVCDSSYPLHTVEKVMIDCLDFKNMKNNLLL